VQRTADCSHGQLKIGLVSPSAEFILGLSGKD